ncbi:MAG: ArnT family glycosyltransferase [Acidimicrobiales bacterium]
MTRAGAAQGSLGGSRARWRRVAGRLRFWRSPGDQPRWARPALCSIALLGALSYGWGMWHQVLEPYYGGAVRSMSMSWHNFFFGSLDPVGSISVDKLPGALWVQSLSVRLFGFHVWAIVAPQVLAGSLTVLVLYRVVRRLGGPVAGIVAAIVLVAASPVTTGLNRDNISDTLLVLTLVLAADGTTAALTKGLWRSLILAGVWVGLGFQFKMVQAWLILPALAVAYLLAGPGSVKRRMLQLASARGICAIVSLSWMTAVTLTPAHSRPYVDGSQHDSVFEQVFVYNGIGRIAGDPAFHTQALSDFADALASPLAAARKSSPGWGRMLVGSEGRNTGWLLPVAVFAGLAVLLTRRRAPRSDPLRTGAVLWGTWLLLNLAPLDSGTFIQPYYAAVLSPAVAALCGLGFREAWCADRSKKGV